MGSHHGHTLARAGRYYVGWGRIPPVPGPLARWPLAVALTSSLAAERTILLIRDPDSFSAHLTYYVPSEPDSPAGSRGIASPRCLNGSHRGSSDPLPETPPGPRAYLSIFRPDSRLTGLI